MHVNEFCLTTLYVYTAATPAQSASASQPLPTPKSVSSTFVTVKEQTLIVDLSEVPNETLGKCNFHCPFL